MGTMNYQVNNGDAYASKYTSQLPKIKEGMGFKALNIVKQQIDNIKDQINYDLTLTQEKRKSLENLKKDVENGKSYDELIKDYEKQIDNIKKQQSEAEKELSKYKEIKDADIKNGTPKIAGVDVTVGLPDKEKSVDAFKIQNKENEIKPVSDNPLLLDA